MAIRFLGWIGAFFTVFIASFASAQQNFSAITLGYTPPYFTAGTGSTLNINSGSLFLGQGIYVSDNCTNPVAKVFISGVTNSPTASDAKFAIKTNSAGNPTTTDALPEVNASAAPVSGTILTSNAFTGTLTPGFYWVQNRNAAGDPVNNRFTVRWWDTGSGTRQFPVGPMGMGVSSWGAVVKSSADSGATWTNTASPLSPSSNVQLVCNNGKAMGSVSQTLLQDTANYVSGTREVGTTCVNYSSGPSLRVKGITGHIAYNGTVPGPAEYCLRTGSAATPGSATCTQAIPASSIITNGGWYTTYFNSVVTIAPNTRFHMTVHVNGGGGDATNRFQIYEVRTGDTAAETLASLPFNSCQQTYTTDGTNFTQTSGRIMGFGLILDDTQPFAVSSGGLIMPTNMTGGTQ